jgi:hypothetical protein
VTFQEASISCRAASVLAKKAEDTAHRSSASAHRLVTGSKAMGAAGAGHSGVVHAPSPICDAAQSDPARLQKKEQGSGPCSENCVDPLFPASSDLIFFGGVTLLLRARAPPETWTTRLSNVGLRPNS